MEERIKSGQNSKQHFGEFQTVGSGTQQDEGRLFGREDMLAGLGWAAVAFFLGICRLPFSVYPLGVSFLCASDRYISFALIGLGAAAFFVPFPVWFAFAVLALTLAVRVLTRLFVDLPIRSREVIGLRGILEHIHGRFFCESVYLRMTGSCVAVFALSLYAIVSGGFRYYDLFGAFFSMAVAPTATFFYCSLFGDIPTSSVWLIRIRRMAKCLLAFSLCLSFNGFDSVGFSLGMAASIAATLILCRKEGLFLGLLTSVLCGIFCGGDFFAILPIVAIVSFCLFDFSPYLSAFVSGAVGGVTGILLGGRDELMSILLPILLGVSFFCTYEKIFVQGSVSCGRSIRCDSDLIRAREAKLFSDINGLCGALKTLSDCFASGSERALDSLCSARARDFADDYQTIASVFEACARCVEGMYREDGKKNIAVRDKLREIGFNAEHVSVCGDEDVKVFVAGLSPVPEYKRLVYLQKQLGRTLDCTLTLPILTPDGNGYRLFAERAIGFEGCCGTSQFAKESVSGDSVCFFEDLSRKHLYTLINDGMGSGSEAAITAGVSTEILRRLLEAGVEPKQALEMLNRFLSRARNGDGAESSSTVDLLCLDKLTGRAVFLKSGAAPTYIKRGTNIFKLNGASLPIGILLSVDVGQIEVEARDGDMIVQVSDGVTGEEDECLWLLNYLNSTAVTDPEEMAEQIKQAAIDNGNRDDISVAVTKIHQKN